MKIPRAILLILFPCFLFSMTCDKKELNTNSCHHSFQFNNQSDKLLYLVISYDYPDTGMNFQRPIFNRLTDYASPGKLETYVNYSDKCIEDIMLNNAYEKMSIFVFDAKLVDSTPWTQVRQNYMVLKRYDYSIDELRNCNFSIDYP